MQGLDNGYLNNARSRYCVIISEYHSKHKNIRTDVSRIYMQKQDDAARTRAVTVPKYESHRKLNLHVHATTSRGAQDPPFVLSGTQYYP